MKYRKMEVEEICKLSNLFAYNDMADMVRELKQRTLSSKEEVFVIEEEGEFIGELHVAYDIAIPQATVPCKRVYLYAFRIHQRYRGQGLSRKLLQFVIDTLEREGYTEFTIGVEEENVVAKNLYRSLGFDRIIGHNVESYNENYYSYDLYIRCDTRLGVTQKDCIG